MTDIKVRVNLEARISSSGCFLFSPTGITFPWSRIRWYDKFSEGFDGLQQSSEAFESSSEILGSLLVIIGIFKDPPAIVRETLYVPP